MCVCVCVCIHVRDIVVKLYEWIPHGKIADAYFWFSLNYLPLLNYGPFTNKGMKFCKCRILKSIIARNIKLVIVTRWTKQAFSCSKFLSPGGQLWANTAFEGSQFYSIGVPKFYSWVNVISVYVHNDLG